jgi:hypothetical protein
MIGFLLANAQGIRWQDSDLWYSLPLIVAISLVYAATRHERMPAILLHAGHTALWILGFMAVVFALLVLVSWFT